MEDLSCQLCGEEVLVDPGLIRNGRAHRECMLRAVLGGIGHLTDHQRWCNEVGDSDMGLTYRESALAVDKWVHEQEAR